MSEADKSVTSAPGAPMRLNHVAITVPPADFTAERQRELIDFYGDVFGWREHRTDEEGNPLVLAFPGTPDFVYILAGEPALTAPRLDHYGVQVSSEEELDDILARAKAWADKDDRVVIIGKKAQVQPPSRLGQFVLTNCYIGFLLPLLVEVQHISRA